MEGTKITIREPFFTNKQSLDSGTQYDYAVTEKNKDNIRSVSENLIFP